MQPIRQIQSKEEFEEFFKTHHANMVRYAMKFVRRTDVASDIVQEAFVKLWESRHIILANVSLQAYLYKVIYNLSLNHLKQLKIRARHHDTIYTDLMELEMDYYKDEKSLIEDERLSSVQKMLQNLPSECYQVIDLSRFQGYKNKEIAKKLQVPVRTIETRIYRCMNKLKELIQKAV